MVVRAVVELLVCYIYYRCLEGRLDVKSRNRTVPVSKAVNLGAMPTFVRLAHRHFEKECPPAIAGWGGHELSYEAPIDLLRLAVSDKTLVQDVESVTFTYRSKQF